jgi:hypothetical protein
MNSKLRELVEVAIEKTERGGLEWIAFDSESFRAKIGSGHLHIQRGSTELSADGENFHPATTYSVQISDVQGRVVAEDEAAEGYDGYTLFNRLFQAARKSALATDRVIDDMLHSLRTSSRA